MLQIARTTTGNNRHSHQLTNSASKLQVIPAPMTVSVPTGKEQFTGTKVDRLFCPMHGINPGWLPSSMSENFPFRHAVVPDSPCIDGHNNALRAELPCAFANKPRGEHSRSIDSYLVGSRPQHASHILGAAQTATNGQWNENLL